MSLSSKKSQYKIKKSFAKKSKINITKQTNRINTPSIVFLYQVLFLYSCFLDGWMINIADGKVKLEISKKKQNNVLFNIDKFIIYNHLY